MNPLHTINRKELESWIDQWQEALYRYAFYRIGNRTDAEDAVQEAFIKVATSHSVITNPKAYLFRTLANICNDNMRSKAPLVQIHPTITSSENDEREAREEYERIEALMTCLNPQQVEVIRLHIHSGLKFTEIAEILDTPVTTLKSRFQSGIEKLKAHLNPKTAQQ